MIIVRDSFLKNRIKYQVSNKKKINLTNKSYRDIFFLKYIK